MPWNRHSTEQQRRRHAHLVTNTHRISCFMWTSQGRSQLLADLCYVRLAVCRLCRYRNRYFVVMSRCGEGCSGCGQRNYVFYYFLGGSEGERRDHSRVVTDVICRTNFMRNTSNCKTMLYMWNLRIASDANSVVINHNDIVLKTSVIRHHA